uniref:Small ribosomal subunit protein bS20c n=1 Tax=Sonderella linearis TaxID=110477 RepID=A0A1Z1MML1_9FLOR|nr:ribosomal protein S20 [Sonderella linearis]ARW67035.1 ribosomal protein S20 [Sonderella linearis]
MSKISSNTKSNRLTLKNCVCNRKYKLAIKKATKNYLLSVKNDNKGDLHICLINLSLVYQKIDKAVKRRVLHKNTAARKKSRLAKIIKQ